MTKQVRGLLLRQNELVPSACGVRKVGSCGEAIFLDDWPVVPDGFCRSGEMIPLGHATETIVFGAGCGGTCDLRTINLAGGSIFIEETFSDFQCPGVCQTGRRGIGFPNSGTLTDSVIGGTGIFEGATGSLTGTVRAAGLQSQIKLSGTISIEGRSASIPELRMRGWPCGAWATPPRSPSEQAPTARSTC